MSVEKLPVKINFEEDKVPSRTIRSFPDLIDWVRRIMFFLLHSGYTGVFKEMSFMVSPRVVGERVFVYAESFLENESGLTAQSVKYSMRSKYGIVDDNILAKVVFHSSESLFNGDAVEKDEELGYGVLTIDKVWFSENNNDLFISLESACHFLATDQCVLDIDIGPRDFIPDREILPTTNLQLIRKALLENKVYFVSDKVLDNCGYIDTVTNLAAISEEEFSQTLNAIMTFDLQILKFKTWHVFPTAKDVITFITNIYVSKQSLWLAEYEDFENSNNVILISIVEDITLEPAITLGDTQCFYLRYWLPPNPQGEKLYFETLTFKPNLPIGALVELFVNQVAMEYSSNQLWSSESRVKSELKLKRILSHKGMFNTHSVPKYCPICGEHIVYHSQHPYITCVNKQCGKS